MVMQGRALDHYHTPESVPTHHQVDTLTFADQAADPSTTGVVQRNGSELVFFDGTRVLSLGGSVWLEAVSSAEATTIAGVAVDLITLTVAVPVTDGVLVVANLRKTAGGATNTLIGLKANATQVHSNQGWSASANAVAQGVFVALLWRQTTSYLRGGFAIRGSDSLTPYFRLTDVDLPLATLTSLTITGSSERVDVTLGVTDVAAYRLVGSL